MAHTVIDNGADVFVAHGVPLPLRGVEIYKGKPIFYGVELFYHQDASQDVVNRTARRRSAVEREPRRTRWTISKR